MKLDFFFLSLSKSIPSSHLLYYAEACNEFAGPISASLRLLATQLFSKKYRSGGEPLTTLRPIWPARDSTSRPRDERVTARPTHKLQSFAKTHYTFHKMQ